MASSGDSQGLGHKQIEAALKDLFDYLITKNPLTETKSVAKLWKSLYESQCLNKKVEISQRNSFEDLQVIRTVLKKDPKSRLILKTWLEGIRPSYIPKLNAREEIEGIKVLLSSTGDPSEKDDTEATNWLKKLFKKPRPEFDKIPKNTSIFVSIFEASKNEALPVIRDMKTWRDLKDKLKEFMINYKQLSPLQILTECDIQIPNWKDYVNNEEIFNANAPVCLPYVARLLKANIRVFQYPDKEEVNFYCKEAGDVTLELCVNKEKFIPVVSIDSDDEKLKQHKTLKAEIGRLKERIKNLESEISTLKSGREHDKKEKTKLETELARRREELQEREAQLKKAQDAKKKAMLKAARAIALDLFHKHIEDETGSDFVIE